MSEAETAEMERMANPLDAKAFKQKRLLQTPADERYMVELGELVRVRVEKVYFHDTGPTRPPKALAAGATAAPAEEAEAISPYRILVRRACGWSAPS
jgi:hypothetical protein